MAPNTCWLCRSLCFLLPAGLCRLLCSLMELLNAGRPLGLEQRRLGFWLQLFSLPMCKPPCLTPNNAVPWMVLCCLPYVFFC